MHVLPWRGASYALRRPTPPIILTTPHMRRLRMPGLRLRDSCVGSDADRAEDLHGTAWRRGRGGACGAHLRRPWPATCGTLRCRPRGMICRRGAWKCTELKALPNRQPHLPEKPWGASRQADDAHARSIRMTGRRHLGDGQSEETRKDAKRSRSTPVNPHKISTCSELSLERQTWDEATTRPDSRHPSPANATTSGRARGNEYTQGFRPPTDEGTAG